MPTWKLCLSVTARIQYYAWELEIDLLAQTLSARKSFRLFLNLFSRFSWKQLSTDSASSVPHRLIVSSQQNNILNIKSKNQKNILFCFGQSGEELEPLPNVYWWLCPYWKFYFTYFQNIKTLVEWREVFPKMFPILFAVFWLSILVATASFLSCLGVKEM